MPSVVALPYKRNNRLDRNKIFAILEAALAVVIWGAAFIAIKIALREVQPYTVIWMRFGMGVIVLGIAGALRKQFAPLTRKQLPYFALLGFLGILYWLLRSSVQITSPSRRRTLDFLCLQTETGWCTIRSRHQHPYARTTILSREGEVLLWLVL